MKLTSSQITQIKDQIDAEPVPDDAPASELLKKHFGDHTFYVDDVGVHVFEADEDAEAQEAGSSCRVVPMRVASWTNEKRDSLSPHEPISGNASVEIDLEE